MGDLHHSMLSLALVAQLAKARLSVVGARSHVDQIHDLVVYYLLILL
jgi:hypothetical protein